MCRADQEPDAHGRADRARLRGRWTPRNVPLGPTALCFPPRAAARRAWQFEYSDAMKNGDDHASSPRRSPCRRKSGHRNQQTRGRDRRNPPCGWSPPYDVHWSDSDRETLVFPGPDDRPAAGPCRGCRRRALRDLRSSTPGSARSGGMFLRLARRCLPRCPASAPHRRGACRPGQRNTRSRSRPGRDGCAVTRPA